jgi:hypothetical protein
MAKRAHEEAEAPGTRQQGQEGSGCSPLVNTHKNKEERDFNEFIQPSEIIIKSFFPHMSLFDEGLLPSGYFQADNAVEFDALGAFLTLRETPVRGYPPTAAAAAAGDPTFYLTSSPPAAAAGSGKERRYACTFEGCSYCAVESHHLKRHLRTHSGERPYACSLCSYTAAEQGTLTRHLSRHSRLGPEGRAKEFTCPEEGCTHTCKSRGALRQHARSSHSTA